MPCSSSIFATAASFSVNGTAGFFSPAFNLAVNGKVPGWGGSAVAVVQANKDRNCLVQAWAPLGGSTDKFNKKIQTACTKIGEQYGKSPSQIALRWIVESGAAFTTCSAKKEHFEEDLDIFDFKLESQVGHDVYY